LNPVVDRLIILKSDDEIKRIAESCRIVAEALDGIKKLVAPGISTKELDDFVESYIISKKAVGDIISLDIGVFYRGFYGDAALTLPVGKTGEDAKKLLAVTEEALFRGIDEADIGNKLFDISYTIQNHAETHGFSVVRNFVGHGIGRELHEEPQIPNFGRPGEGITLLQGMTLAIEPMINVGGWEVDILKDGWTAITRDRSLSAHFEHTVAITSVGPKPLTKL
jgi:methionyl aminopeptidase